MTNLSIWVALGPKLKPENVVLIGIRDLDSRERELVAASKVHVFTMKEIDLLGMSEVCRRTVAAVTSGTKGFHVSLDLDGIDPAVAPGVGHSGTRRTVLS